MCIIVSLLRSPPTPRKMNENISQDSKPNIETNEIRPRNRSPVIYRNKIDKIQVCKCVNLH